MAPTMCYIAADEPSTSLTLGCQTGSGLIGGLDMVTASEACRDFTFRSTSMPLLAAQENMLYDLGSLGTYDFALQQG